MDSTQRGADGSYYYYAEMVADPTGGEGMFTPVNLINGQTYILTVDVSVAPAPAGQGTVVFAAANGLVQNQSTSNCQSATQSISNKQTLGSITSTTSSPYSFPEITISGGTSAIGAYTGYTQLWVYTTFTSGSSSFSSQTKEVYFCPVCNLAAPTGLGVTNGGITLAWTAESGAASYNIVVTDTHNGTPTETALSSNSASVNFCAQGVGDNVSYYVEPVCPNGAPGTVSSPYSYTYSPAALATPTGVTFNQNYPYTVSWNPVPGATYYWYEVQGDAPVVVNGTSVTDPDAMLSFSNTYHVSVSAANGCVSSSYSTPIQVVMPAACGAPTVSVVEGTYIQLYPVSGAASYNLGFENSSGQIVYQINDVPTSITSSGYTVTGVPSGYYYVVAQTNCTSGSTGPWGSPYDNSMQYVYFVTPLQSRTSGVAIPGMPGDTTIALSVYPNPSRSQANIIYNTPVTGSADLIVTTELGNTVIHKAISTVAGQNSYALDIGQLANGIYFIKLTDGKNIRYQKLVVAK